MLISHIDRTKIVLNNLGDAVKNDAAILIVISIEPPKTYEKTTICLFLRDQS